MSDSKVFDSLIRIHNKIDKQSEDIADLKVAIAELPCGSRETRLRIVEKIVYGAVIIVLIAFMVSLAGDSPKKSMADTITITKRITKK